MLGLVVGVGYESSEWHAMYDTMDRCLFGRKEHSNLVYGIPSYPALRSIQTDAQLFSSLFCSYSYNCAIPKSGLIF